MCDWNHKYLGVLNCTDAEVPKNNLSITTSDLSKLEHPLWSSLPAQKLINGSYVMHCLSGKESMSELIVDPRGTWCNPR